MREFILTNSAPVLTPLHLTLLLLSSLTLAYHLSQPNPPLPLLLLLLLPPLLVLLLLRHHIHSSSLLCTAALGLTLTTRHWGGGVRVRFVDWGAVEGVGVGEGVEGMGLVDGVYVMERRRAGGGGVGGGRVGDGGWVDGRRVVRVFEGLRPRLCVTRLVYRGVRGVMYNEVE